MLEQIPNWLMQRKQLTPNQIALIHNEDIWTFEQLHKEAVQVAYQLRTRGIQKGMHVALLLNNSPNFIKVVHALTYLGAVIVCLNVRLTKEELCHQINDSDAEHLITNEWFKNQYCFEQIKISTIEDVQKSKPTEIALQTHMKLSDSFTIMYTSGTTGRPKGVVHTYGNYWSSAMASALNLGIQQNDSWLSCLPMFHIGGFSIVIRTVIYGMSLRLFEKFDEAKIHQALMSKKVTIISVVAVMLERLLTELELCKQNYPLAVRCILLGGSAVSEDTLQRARSKKVPIYQSYGLTETTSQIATNLKGERAILGSSGKPLFTAQLKIMNPDQTGAGEIAVAGPMVTKGYYKNIEATKTVFQEGWLLTGDIGKLDKEGNLFVLDRRTDLIISGGENIYPQEIEKALEELEGIQAAGVIGSKSKQWGEVPIAFVEAKKHINETALLKSLKTKLAKYKIPKRIYKITTLPRNALGKLQRAKLRDLEELYVNMNARVKNDQK